MLCRTVNASVGDTTKGIAVFQKGKKAHVFVKYFGVSKASTFMISSLS